MNTIEVEDLGVLMVELDDAVAGARSVLSGKSEILLKQPSLVDDPLQRMRLAVPLTIKAVRWFRQRADTDGRPPLLQYAALNTKAFDDVIDAIDTLNNLIHPAPSSAIASRTASETLGMTARTMNSSVGSRLR